MKKVVITFGLISGGIISVLMVSTASVWQEMMDFNLGMIIGYLTMVVALSMVFVGIRSFRDNHNGGIVSFGKAFQVGILIAVIASVMYAITWEIYYNVSASDFMEKYTEHYIQEMQRNGASQAEIDQMTAEMNQMAENYKNPVIRFGMTLMEIIPVGLAITLISSLILKRKEKTVVI
jgi:hypothetical protein